MADQPETIKSVRALWSEVRAFCTLWLAFTSLGGFFVLVGGPKALGLLRGIFGHAAGQPGRVITLLMLFSLPLAIYFFLQQKRLAEISVLCEQCGERFPKENNSCPRCGCARSPENIENETVAAAKS